jgi:hypothetical protein
MRSGSSVASSWLDRDIFAGDLRKGVIEGWMVTVIANLSNASVGTQDNLDGLFAAGGHRGAFIGET